MLVTGAAGFIGSSVTRRLLELGAAVTGVDNFTDNYSLSLKRRNVGELDAAEGFHFVETDICDADAISRATVEAAPQRVVHLAGLGNVRRSLTAAGAYVATNVGGTANVLDAAVAAGVDHVVFASTSSIYGQRTDVPFRESDRTDAPLAPYPATKKASEVLGHAYHVAHGISFTALRFFNAYGPRGRPDMMPWIVLEALVREHEIPVFAGGTLLRDWTFIDDVVDGVIAALARPFGYEILNIGRGSPIALTDFIDVFSQLVGAQPRVRSLPAPPTEPRITFADISKASELLGYAPRVSVEQGVRRFYEWWLGARDGDVR